MARILKRGFNCTMVQNHGLCRFISLTRFTLSALCRKRAFNWIFLCVRDEISVIMYKYLHKPWFCTVVHLKPLTRIRANNFFILRKIVTLRIVHKNLF